MRPGQYFEVDYLDDDVAHERVALWPVDAQRWAVRSPDGDEWIESLSGADPENGPSASRPRRRGAGGVPRLYRFRAQLTDRELKGAIIRGLKLAGKAVGGVEHTPVVAGVKDEDGDDAALEEFFRGTVSAPMRQAIARALERGGGGVGGLPLADAAKGGAAAADWAVATVGDSPPDEVWIACSAGATAAKGTEIRLTLGRDVVFGGRRAMHLDAGTWVFAERVPAAEAPAFADGLWAGAPPAEAPPAEASSGLRKAPVEARGGSGEPAGKHTDDLRTLWVDWDAHGERFKAWRDVCRESTSEELDEQRLEGAATALHMCKAMERQGGDPKLWLEKWLREKRLEGSDRVAHELRCLTDVLYMVGTVDQLNVGGLHCVESLCRRIAAIVEAYAVPGRPSWEHARYYAGVGTAEEVVAPALRTHVLRRAKDEAEVSTARARTWLRGGPAEGTGGEDDGAAAAGAGATKRGAGRGRGKSGRGDWLPAAT